MLCSAPFIWPLCRLHLTNDDRSAYAPSVRSLVLAQSPINQSALARSHSTSPLFHFRTTDARHPCHRQETSPHSSSLLLLPGLVSLSVCPTCACNRKHQLLSVRWLSDIPLMSFMPRILIPSDPHLYHFPSLLSPTSPHSPIPLSPDDGADAISTTTKISFPQAFGWSHLQQKPPLVPTSPLNQPFSFHRGSSTL